MAAPRRDLANIGFLDVGSMVAEINEQVTKLTHRETAAAMTRWADSLKNNTKDTKSMLEIHEEVAEEARKTTVRAYKASHAKTGYYRSGDQGKNRRYSNGAMEQALEAGLYKVTATRIYFGNKKAMDKKAEQWYRLNFGAGPSDEGVAPPVPTPMKFFKKPSRKSFNLSNYRSSPAMWTPEGFFSGSFKGVTDLGKYGKARSDGANAFYLKSATKGATVHDKAKRIEGRRTTMEGRYFLNKGVDEINKLYPERVMTQFRDWERSARNDMKV